MLGSPVVIGPLSPCSHDVRVQGQLPGATVRVIATPVQGAARIVANRVVSGADEFVKLTVGRRLLAGDRVTAEQHTASDHGDALPPESGVEVSATPDVQDLAGLFANETLLECGTCLWVAGVVPGASVTLSINGGTAWTAEASSDTVKFVLPAGQRLDPGDSLEVSQEACGIAGPTVALADPVAQGRTQSPMPAPRIVEPLIECQRGIRVEEVLPGATVVVTLDGQEHRACFGYRQGWFGLPRALRLGDVVAVRQDFHFCELASTTTEAAVRETIPPPPGVLRPVCEGDRIVRVAGLFQGALVEFASNGATLCLAAAADTSGPFGVPSLLGATELSVRQSLCDGAEGTWSDWSSVPVRALGPQGQPSIVRPLFDGGVAVGVTDLKKGTFVEVVGRKGVLGQSWGDGDARIDVPLWFSLVADDQVHLRTRRCGQVRDWPDETRVGGARDVRPPRVADPACDCGGSILVHDVLPGAIVEAYAVKPSQPPVLLGIARAGNIDISVDVPALAAGDQVYARQRLRGIRSSPGPVGTSPLTPVWSYVPDSAFRLCQLTQDWDPTNRPHGAPTSPIGITGTDLGIPVEHKSVLYFFFGDSADAPESETDGDPIGWTTADEIDDFEDAALDMHWITGADGQFRRLSVDGWNPLGNFEVPTGGVSYDGHLYVFIGKTKIEPPSRMTSSHLVVGDNPQNDFISIQPISSTVGGQILVMEPDGSFHPAPYPGKRWLLHISPTVVANADWPGLPSSTGDGLLMFGSSAYRGTPPGDLIPAEQSNSNVYLAWAPLTPGTSAPHSPIPHPEDWHIVSGFDPSGLPVWGTLRSGDTPIPLLRADPWGPRLLGEISVVWYRPLRRWILAGSVQGPINLARQPWGPWTPTDTIVDASKPDRDAGQSLRTGHWTDTEVLYAPYLVKRWLRWDRSSREATLYFTISVFDDPGQHHGYQPQLMRSSINCWT